jgi:4-hydroxybenzoate polyprenyltransferase
MAATTGEAVLPILHRLWIYQRERFPLARTAVLLAAFSAASINVSAQLAGRTLPQALAYIVAFVVALILFFQLRACDEIKDADDDRRFRPERPIPRGLVTQRLIVGIAAAGVPVAVLACASLDLRLLVPLAAVWIWMGLMTAEFFVPDWLKARPFLYLVSHMAIMPLIDLFITACEWLTANGRPPAGLWLFLVLSFINGCVLELGRKIYAPVNERTGVETYSSLLGPRHAILLWCTVMIAAFAFLLAVGVAVEAPRIVGAIGSVACLACLAGGWSFLRSPDAVWQKRIDALSGLWVLVCYGSAGLVPIALRGWLA